MSIVSKMGLLLRLLRPKNLFMLYLTQIICFWKINNSLIFFHQLYWATCLSAATGYLINDFFDQVADKINKPEKYFIQFFDKKFILGLYFFLIAISLWILKEFFWAILLTNFLLYAYAFYLKKSFLWGNLLVATMGAWSIIFVLWINQVYLVSLLFFAFFAFMTHLLREIIKDIEDIEGDRLLGCRSLPIVLGIEKTKSCLLILLFLNSLFLFVFACFQNIIFLSLSFLILIFQFGIGKKIVALKTKSDASRLSAYCKYLMLMGLILMFFA